MKRRFEYFINILMLVCLCFSPGGFAYTHIVQEGESLSQVADSKVGRPIYGKNGSLIQILALNPKVKNADHVYAGVELLLPLPRNAVAAVKPEVKSTRTSQAKRKVSMRKIASVETVGAEAPEFNRYSTIQLDFGFKFWRIDGVTTNGGTGTLLSELSPGFALKWKQFWSEDFTTELGGDFTKAKFAPAANSVAIESHEVSVSSIHGGMSYGLSKTFQIRWSLFAAEDLFYNATNSSSVSLIKAMIPKTGIGLSTLLASLRPFKFSLLAEGAYHAPGKTNAFIIQSGYSYRGAMVLQQYFQSKWFDGIQGSFYYEYSRQDTSLMRRTRTNFGITLGLTLRLESSASSP